MTSFRCVQLSNPSSFATTLSACRRLKVSFNSGKCFLARATATATIWGTLAVGIFSTNPDHSFMTQLIGVGAYGVFCFAAALLIFYGLKATFGLRVSPEEERIGLDVSEHGMEAYGGFQITHR